MSDKIKKLVKDVRVELSEAAVADKEGANVRVKVCLLHANKMMASFIKKEYGYE